MNAKNLRPFILSASIIIIDQITKAMIVKKIPEGTIGKSLFGDYLRIIHVRNDAVAFSIGHMLPYATKIIGFVILPMILIGFLSYFVLSDKQGFREWEKWCFAGIIGGGMGNLIDRLFRHLRVVDWISTKNYGWFGMDRFPTYNIADASVVISVIVFVLFCLISLRSKHGKDN